MPKAVVSVSRRSLNKLTKELNAYAKIDTEDKTAVAKADVRIVAAALELEINRPSTPTPSTGRKHGIVSPR